MSNNTNRSATGIPELDGLLGGGFPKGSVILLSGASGTGKTSLSLEWLFNGVRMFDEKGIYITFTEPLFKTLKNLEGLEYYDRQIIEDEGIKILDIRKSLAENELDENKILNLIEEEVKKNDAQRLIIDSITAVAYNLENKARIRRFVFDLGTMLASLGCTTILTSEVVGEGYSVYGVEEFISDGIIKLEQKDVKFQSTRTLKIMKMRGVQYAPYENSFRITSAGIKIFPQLSIPLTYASEMEKISIGVKGLDEMTHGGVYRGSSNLIAGSSGTGKSILGLHFIAEGLRQNEPCLIAGFEESRDQIIRNAGAFGWDFEGYEQNGLLKIMCSYPSEKYIDEHLLDIRDIVENMEIKRIVVDSLSSIGNAFEEGQFRYFVKRLNGYLKSIGATSIFTTATASLMSVETLTDAHLSTMTDNIVILKYVESGGEIQFMAAVLKTRGDDHSKSLRRYSITKKGIVVGETFRGYEGVLSGTAKKISSTILEQVRQEFIRNIGPMGDAEFDKIKKKGAVTLEDIITYVDSLVTDGIIDPEKGDLFKGRIKLIFEGGILPSETKGISDRDLIKLGIIKRS